MVVQSDNATEPYVDPVDVRVPDPPERRVLGRDRGRRGVEQGVGADLCRPQSGSRLPQQQQQQQGDAHSGAWYAACGAPARARP